MGLEDLQSFIIESFPEILEKVDCLRLQGLKLQPNPNGGSLKLLIDGECCLDRLYGGYFPDWVCGGQWKQMELYLENMLNSVQNSFNNMELIVFFNGALEADRMDTNWLRKQQAQHQNLQEIQRHISSKNKPPPKVWWLPPTFLRSAIRNTMRSLNGKTIFTLEDHHKEIIRFAQKDNVIGIISDDPEFLIYHPTRYFSAHKMKLTFKGSLETDEMKLKNLYEKLDLPKERFAILATLLGNHIVTETDLAKFVGSFTFESHKTKKTVIEKILQFTRNLEQTEPEAVAELIAKTDPESSPEFAKILTEKVVKSIRYYSELMVKICPQPKSRPNKSKGIQKQKEKAKESEETSEKNDKTEPEQDEKETQEVTKPDQEKEPITPTTNGASNEAETPEEPSKETQRETKEAEEKPPTDDKQVYRVNHQIHNIAINRVSNGLMSQHIYHLFKHREIKIPLIIEAVFEKDLPKSIELYRPLRQRVYAILFNLHHLRFMAGKEKKEKGTPTIQVKENYYCAQSKENKTVVVDAIEIGWGVPTVERLWLGDGEECKQKRIKAFLTVMNSDRQVILETSFVPQNMLMLTVVLRYMLTYGGKFMRKYEMDSLIAQAFIQELTDPASAQEIELKGLNMRGVHLANLFMQGLEMACFANDACGSCIPSSLVNPSLFFNGKIFNYILERQLLGKTIAEICNYKADLLYKIDQLRLAVMDGLKPEFAPSPNTLLFSNGGLMGLPQDRGYRPIPNRLDAFDLSLPLHSSGMGNGNLISRAGSRGNPPLMGQGMRGGGRDFTTNMHLNPYLASNQQISRSGGAGNFGYSYGPQQNSYNPNHMNYMGQRKIYPGVHTRGGHLQVGGQVVANWGGNANYAQFSGYSPYASRQQNATTGFMRNNMNSLFDNMRISRGPKPTQTQNRKGGGAGRGQQKKPNAKKSNDGASKQTKSNSSENKSKKEVSFKEENGVTNENEGVEETKLDESTTSDTEKPSTDEPSSPKIEADSSAEQNQDIEA